MSHRKAFVPECREERSPLPAGYLDFVRRTVRREMDGFHKGYTAAAWSYTPSVSSCTGSSRKKGGCRALRPDRSSYLRRVLGDEYFEVDNLVKYEVVNTGGKARGVTVASPDLSYLAPLHKTLYDHLAQLPWLLRGEAKPGRFSSFVQKEGEVFVSGDYESASDNLRVEVAMAIVDTLQSMAPRIPSSVWEAARAFLHCRIKYPDLGVPMQSEGQLMGNLLCFPLLCLQNYIAFRWVFPERIPVKINGDDIVFRTTRARYEVWAEFVSSVGLVLSRGKTLVSAKFFSLNSSFFWARTNKMPRLIPVTRVSCFGKEFEDFGALSGSYRSFTRGYRLEAKLRAEVLFLKHFRGYISGSGRSVRRGLNIPASIPSLKESGLWKRECWYFDSVHASHDVLPESPSRMKWGSLPPGWRRTDVKSCRVTGQVTFYSPSWYELPFAPPLPSKPVVQQDRIDALQRAFWQDLISRTWTVLPTRGQLVEDYKRNVYGTGWERRWQEWRKPSKRLRFLKAFATLRRVDPSPALGWVYKRREPTCWWPVDEGRVEELVEGCSPQELCDWERQVGLMTFEPPSDYERVDVFDGMP